MGRRIAEEIVREFGIDMYTPLYLKWITSKVLLYSMWNSAQYYVAVWLGGEFGGECICMAESVYSSPETIPTVLIG